MFVFVRTKWPPIIYQFLQTCTKQQSLSVSLIVANPKEIAWPGLPSLNKIVLNPIWITGIAGIFLYLYFLVKLAKKLTSVLA